MRRRLAAAFAAIALCVAPAQAGPPGVPEPNGLWMGAIPGYTPETLKGATVVDSAGAIRLVAGGALAIDVSQPDRKPETLPPTALWRPQHRSIPGAAWFPDSGWGDLAPEREMVLRARVLELAGDDRSKAVLVFCHPDCWGSWNMGKRLATWGFTDVNWYPEGLEGWQRADQPTAVVKPDAAWAATAAALR